jgi:hypothetical protein
LVVSPGFGVAEPSVSEKLAVLFGASTTAEVEVHPHADYGSVGAPHRRECILLEPDRQQSATEIYRAEHHDAELG